jgi:hypothetical protein
MADIVAKDVRPASNNVRCGGQSGKHLLFASISGFDLERTLLSGLRRTCSKRPVYGDTGDC